MAMSGDGPSGRMVAHFDADCFYAQAEVLRRPYLKDLPVGVTQKYLVVTCNYVARSLGVPKMSSIDEAKRRCPEIVLINGEDLTPYRVASKQILEVLRRFGTVERLGLDEAAVDISAEVRNRSAAGARVQNFSGYAAGREVDETCTVGFSTVPQSEAPCDQILMLASHLVTEIRTAVERETGFRLSCGISHNKMLAKLVCSVNKPNKQTSLPQAAVATFLNPLPIRKIPGVGKRTESILTDMGAETVRDAQKFSEQELSARLGDRIGRFLYNAFRGFDFTPVHDKGHCKSLSVEDSFRVCTTLNAAKERFRSLAPDLIFRLDTDREETGRKPALFTLKWRYQESWKFTSLSAPMPRDLSSKSTAFEKRVEAAVEVAMRLLSRGLRERSSYNLAVLNIGATSFEPETTRGSKSDIRLFLTSADKLPKMGSVKVLSKRDARAQRELSENEKAVSVGSSLLPAPEQDSSMDRLRLFGVLAAAEEAEKMLLMGPANDSETTEDNRWEDIEGCAGPMRATWNGEHHATRKPSAPTNGELGHCSSVCKFSSRDGNRGAMHHDLEAFDLCLVGQGIPGSKGDQFLSHDSERSSSCISAATGDGEGAQCLRISKNEVQEVNHAQVISEMSTSESATAKPDYGKEGRHSQKGGENIHSSPFYCAKCQLNIDYCYVSIQEHEDYHFALQLDKQEKGLQKGFYSACESSKGKRKSRENMRCDSVLKRLKLRNSTLDAFVIQHH